MVIAKPKVSRCAARLLAVVFLAANAAMPALASAPPPINLTPWRISNYNGEATAIGRVAAADANKDGNTDFMGIYFGYGNSMVWADNASSQLGTNPDGTPKLDVRIRNFGRQTPKFWDGNGDGYYGYVVSGGNGLYYRDRDANGLVGGDETEIAIQWCAACQWDGGPRYGETSFLDVGDIDGDGSQDVVLTGDRWNPNIRVFLNHGGILTAGAVIHYPGGSWDSTGVKLADFDGDGKLDIVFSKLVEPGSPPAPNLYHNNGDGTFTPFSLPGLALCAGGLAVADANGDGKPDIFISAIAENNPDGSFVALPNHAVFLFTNNGNMAFTRSSAVTAPTSQYLYSMDAGDLNGDGKADIAVAFYDQNAWPTPLPRVYAGDGAGNFTQAWSNGQWGANTINIINYNGRPAFATSGYNGVSYLYANFNPPETFSWSTGDYGACSATCGDGTQTRRVTCAGSLGTVDDSGAKCAGAVPASSQSCNLGPCPVNCVVGDFTAWGACSASCGGGTQSRTRPILTAPLYGGLACPSLGDSQACNLQSCDTDGDGVPDSADRCPGTAAGAPVDASGCSGAQLLAIACPTTASYKNHGAYVSCVSKTADSLVSQGLVTSAQKDTIVSTAAQSDIGKK